MTRARPGWGSRREEGYNGPTEIGRPGRTGAETMNRRDLEGWASSLAERQHGKGGEDRECAR
jgi:hypothetical protein